MTTIRTIKKYPNRRLYDTAISSYITLEDIRELVCTQTAFQVVDVRSGNDITRSTLLQIIQDQEERGEPLFSTDALFNAIRCYDADTQALTSSVLEHAMRVMADKQVELDVSSDTAGILHRIADCQPNEMACMA